MLLAILALARTVRLPPTLAYPFIIVLPVIAVLPETFRFEPILAYPPAVKFPVVLNIFPVISVFPIRLIPFELAVITFATPFADIVTSLLFLITKLLVPLAKPGAVIFPLTIKSILPYAGKPVNDIVLREMLTTLTKSTAISMFVLGPNIETLLPPFSILPPVLPVNVIPLRYTPLPI